MTPFFNIPNRRKTKVTVQASYNLVRRSVQFVLEDSGEITVIDNLSTSTELLSHVSKNKPDVVLLCLMENEGKNIKFLTELFEISPETKVVILSGPNSQLDQTAALQLGVTGIVGFNQNFRVLIRAIQQVSEGEVWLNQKLIAQLLDNKFNLSATKSKNKNYYKSDDLTCRELEVVGLIGMGLTNKDISKKLYISEATVRHHLGSIYSKLDVEDRLNLAIYAYRERIIQPSEMAM